MMADTRRTNGEPDPDTIKADIVNRHLADKWPTRTGGAAKANNTRRAQGGQVRQVADKWWTRTGGTAKANNTRRTRGGHMADKPEHIAARPFFLRENPQLTVCGKKTCEEGVGERQVGRLRVPLCYVFGRRKKTFEDTLGAENESCCARAMERVVTDGCFTESARRIYCVKWHLRQSSARGV